MDKIDIAVDKFAQAMKNKLKAKASSKEGWGHGRISNFLLSHHLIEHVGKGDPIDVANFCMMLFDREENINEKVRSPL